MIIIIRKTAETGGDASSI